MTLTLSKVLISLGLLSSAWAHTYLSSVTVGGVDQGERACLRGLYSGGASNIFASSPIQDVTVFPAGLTGANMTCGFLPYAAQGTANRKCPVNAGDTMGMTWHHNSNAASDDIIDASHVGPCMVYMARSDTGSGAVWFKIFEEGYNAANQLWCSIRVKNNKGYMEFTIPSTLPSGNYLVRGEIIALHDGNKPNGAQPYVSCAEVTVTGPANGVMPASSYMVSIPGAYSANDPGILFNIYNSYNSYTIPGPPVYTAQALPTGNPTTTTTTTTQATTQNPTTQTSQATSQNPTTQTSAAPTTNSCGDIVSQCLTLCGTRGTTSCQCVNGSPSIICASETSAASCLRPFWFF